MIQLGLIGDNIRESRAPKLHQICGDLCGLNIQYDLLIPKEQQLEFDPLFQRCQGNGFRGLNITLPYKIKVVPKLTIPDPLVKRIGSINTVVFDGQVAFGYNTDFTGFIAAFRNRFGSRSPGRVALIGAGGAGKAVAFALLSLGVESLNIFDANNFMSTALAADLAPTIAATVAGDIDEALHNCEGVINCTPLGMVGYGGTAVPARLLVGKKWVFDAVYTPMETEFLNAAQVAGLEIMSGYELHFYQGILAFEHFTGLVPPDLAEVRRRHLAAFSGS